MTDRFVLALDQGTTSTRAILFDQRGRPLAVEQKELPQHYPADGWVEHDAEEIFADTVAVAAGCLARAGLSPGHLAGIGITNQRETTVLWERTTGRPLHNAIVWQDRRSTPLCRQLIADGHETLIRERTGLVVDPYFSGTKLAWLLDNLPGARQRAERGELCFGTIDSWLLFRLSGGQVHATDATNAARTLLFDIRRNAWDPELCRLLDIPRALLPQVLDNAANFGATRPGLFGQRLPIAGMAGDQQAALIGQACFHPGMVKSTYGTGAFALMTIGPEFRLSGHRLLTTIGYRLAGETVYALEGAIFVAGAAVQWLRDGLKIIRHAAETEALAEAVPDAGGVHLVPAFTGLGAPWWDPEARGALLGLTRDSDQRHIARATLEAQGHQTRDLIEAMAADAGAAPASLRVDGGMVANGFVCQAIADLTGVPLERPEVTETTALGAAFLAGLQQGVWPSLEAVAATWRGAAAFTPRLTAEERAHRAAGWRRAVAQVLHRP